MERGKALGRLDVRSKERSGQSFMMDGGSSEDELARRAGSDIARGVDRGGSTGQVSYSPFSRKNGDIDLRMPLTNFRSRSNEEQEGVLGLWSLREPRFDSRSDSSQMGITLLQAGGETTPPLSLSCERKEPPIPETRCSGSEIPSRGSAVGPRKQQQQQQQQQQRRTRPRERAQEKDQEEHEKEVRKLKESMPHHAPGGCSRPLINSRKDGLTASRGPTSESVSLLRDCELRSSYWSYAMRSSSSISAGGGGGEADLESTGGGNSSCGYGGGGSASWGRYTQYPLEASQPPGGAGGNATSHDGTINGSVRDPKHDNYHSGRVVSFDPNAYVPEMHDFPSAQDSYSSVMPTRQPQSPPPSPPPPPPPPPSQEPSKQQFVPTESVSSGAVRGPKPWHTPSSVVVTWPAPGPKPPAPPASKPRSLEACGEMVPRGMVHHRREYTHTFCGLSAPPAQDQGVQSLSQYDHLKSLIPCISNLGVHPPAGQIRTPASAGWSGAQNGGVFAGEDGFVSVAPVGRVGAGDGEASSRTQNLSPEEIARLRRRKEVLARYRYKKGRRDLVRVLREKDPHRKEQNRARERKRNHGKFEKKSPDFQSITLRQQPGGSRCISGEVPAPPERDSTTPPPAAVSVPEASGKSE